MLTQVDVTLGAVYTTSWKATLFLPVPCSHRCASMQAAIPGEAQPVTINRYLVAAVSFIRTIFVPLKNYLPLNLWKVSHAFSNVVEPRPRGSGLST